MQLSMRAMLQLCLTAGFPADTCVEAAATGYAESSLVTNAVNRNTNGSVDLGVFQINSVHKPAGMSMTAWTKKMFSPIDNAKEALRISGGGRNWSPWYAHGTSRYRTGLKLAREEWAKLKADTKSGTGEVKTEVDAGIAQPLVDGIAGITGGVTDFVGALTDWKTWARVGMAVGGALLLIAAIAMLAKEQVLPAATKTIARVT